MEDLYGDPLAIWRDWADDVRGQRIDCGHHVDCGHHIGEEAPAELASLLTEFFAPAPRVPFADFNLLKLPDGQDFERDFTMLSDIFPTGYHGAELAGVKPGDTVAVFGAGPVGLLAAHSSYLRGAARVFVVDMQPDRLALAERFGATPISIADGDPAGQIIGATGGAGADRGIEAVGYQAHDPTGQEHPDMVLDALVKAVRTTGGIGVVGV
jgi:glutathione-independent formaldehyde dehydrogenase